VTGAVADPVDRVADAQDEAAARSGGSVPTREMADKLAADLPAGRTGWDGSPLNEKDRRLYALRESGYKGPIDQDGYPATTGEAADILRRLATDRGESPDW
jgi:hypothetical protein